MEINHLFLKGEVRRGVAPPIFSNLPLLAGGGRGGGEMFLDRNNNGQIRN